MNTKMLAMVMVVGLVSFSAARASENGPLQPSSLSIAIKKQSPSKTRLIPVGSPTKKGINFDDSPSSTSWSHEHRELWCAALAAGAYEELPTLYQQLSKP